MSRNVAPKSAAMNPKTMRSQAQAVVVGGGVVGWTDVVLVERDVLTSGSTWYAAGAIRRAFSGAHLSIRMGNG